MAISDADIKKLWGLAAGRCSKPECGIDCIPFLDPNDPTTIGEMAHIIPQSPNGPRGLTNAGLDTYENLILLCPTHHRTVDKAPLKFPSDVLHKWKNDHEERIRSTLQEKPYETVKSLANEIGRILSENHAIWKYMGPESDEAKKNPLSNLHVLWKFKKLSTIVPNNRRVINLLKINRHLWEKEEYDICMIFSQHAESFEANCHDKFEGSVKFPREFEELINARSKIQ